MELALSLNGLSPLMDYVKLSIDYWIKVLALVVVVLRQSDFDDQESYCREPIALMSCDVEGRGKADGAFWLIADYSHPEHYG